MSKNSAEAIDIRFLLASMLMWLVCAAILLPVSALFAHFLLFGEKALAYTSSALSFITAVFAGAKAMRVRKSNAVLTSFITGVCIVLLSLTLGFIIAGDKLKADGILSVVTFTLAGCLVGGVFFAGRTKKAVKASKPQVRKRQNTR